MHLTDFQDALKHLPFVLATGTQIQMSGQRILEAVLIAVIAALGSGYVTSKQLETQFTEFKTAARSTTLRADLDPRLELVDADVRQQLIGPVRRVHGIG